MKKIILSVFGLIVATALSAQTYPKVSITQIRYVSPQTLQNCSDSSAYLGDTVTTRGIVITPGNLSEVASSSITKGSRPFVTLRDTANNGAAGAFSGIVVMGADPKNSPVSAIENVAAGDIIEITGIVGYFNGLIQLQPINQSAVSLKGTTTAPSYSSIYAGDIQDQNGNNVLTTGEKWEGEYVELKNVTVIGVSIFASNSRCEFTVADSMGNQVLVADRFLPMVVKGTKTVNPNSPDSAGSLIPPTVGTKFKHIRGVIFQDENGCTGGGSFAGGYEINPFDSTDMEKAPSPPTIYDVKRTPSVPNSTQSVDVSADIFDNDGVVTSATLYYSADQTTARNLFSSISMTNVGSIYSATIPANPLDTIVRYYISATDDSSKTSTYPYGTEEFYTVRANGMTIMDIQKVLNPMNKNESEYVGDTVTVTGYVTASYQSWDLQQLYIQDSAATEYAGIFVAGGPTSVFGLKRGEGVTIKGVVDENYEFTRIQALTVTPLTQSATIKPIVLNPSDTNYFRSKSTLERYESMLVRYENPNGKVNIINPNIGFGEYTVGSGDTATTTAGVLAGVQSSSVQSSVNVSVVADSAYYAAALNVPAIQADTTQDMDALIGIMYYSFNKFKLTPRGNGDFINFSATLVGLKPFVDTKLKASIYPNPSIDKVNIQLDENYSFDKLDITIFDLSGRKVLEQQTNVHFNSLNLSTLEKGMYILRITDNGEMVNTSKLILK